MFVVDKINTITDGIVDASTAMEIFKAANLIGAHGLAVIATFEDEVQKAAALLVKKREQEGLMAKYQKRVSTLQAALGTLNDPTANRRR